MRLRFVTVVPLLALLAGLFSAACGPNCTRASACAVIGQPPNLALCDGNDYRACADSNRGQTVPCAPMPEIALCTPNGWTFVPAPPGH